MVNIQIYIPVSLTRPPHTLPSLFIWYQPIVHFCIIIACNSRYTFHPSHLVSVAMAQIEDMANLEAQLTTLGSLVEHLAQTMKSVPESSSERSNIDGWLDEMNDFTANMKQARTQLSSCTQRWHDANIEELLGQKEAEMKKREELLEQRIAGITRREQLLEQRTRAVNEREEMIRRKEHNFERACQSLERYHQDFSQTINSLGSGVSSPAPNPRPATRQDSTANPSPNTFVPPGQAGDPATDPSGLSLASEHVRNVWRQIEFPVDWTAADSVILLANFEEAHRRKGGKDNRQSPQQSMDRGSRVTHAYCLTRDLRRNGMMASGRRCDSHTPNQLCIDVFHTTDNPGEYNSAATDKRWRLEKRR